MKDKPEKQESVAVSPPGSPPGNQAVTELGTNTQPAVKKAPRQPKQPAQGYGPTVVLPTYRSAQALATAGGIELELLQAARAAGADGFPKRGGVEVAKLLGWLLKEAAGAVPGGEVKRLDANYQLSLDGMEAGLSERAKLDLYRSKRERTRYLREIGELVSINEVKFGLTAGMNKLFESLERVLMGELPPAVVGLRELEIRSRMGVGIEELKVQFRRQLEQMVKEPEAKDKK